ncbi:glycosyltransferase family 4 protein [Halobacteriales archaeon QS_1_68_17]|nr:MAG: glycosyltransferase family 4 protein [Halobacteriales archaeon QS_1_68_17]
MHVGILVKEFPPNVIGGTETQTRRMASELQQRGHEITVYTKSYGDSEPHSDAPFDLVRIPNWRYSDFTSTMTFVLAVTIYLLRDSRQLDVLQCMMIYPNGFVGYIVSLATGLPYFAWIRGGDFYFMKENPAKRWTMKRVAEDTLVLVQAENIRADVRGEFPDARLAVLGNGVDIPAEMADGDAVIYVGRLKEQKGVEHLLHAMEGFDDRLLVVGDGPRRSELESLAVSLGVNAEFVGEVEPEAVSSYLLESRVFVLPSVAGEGLPNAMLEAMAHGIPVVATDVAGVGNVVENGETGFVVDPGDRPALRNRLKSLLDDEKLRSRMGRQAREYVEERHSWDRIESALSAYYERLTSSSG